MTTRPKFQPQRYVRSAVRRPFTAAVTGVVAAALMVTGMPTAASAAVPDVAQKWSSLMYHSLTPSTAYVQLQKTVAAQRATLAARATKVTSSKTTHVTAQTALAAAVTTDAATRTRYAIAREGLATARNRLTVVSQARPRNAAAVASAKDAVTARAKSAAIRREQASQASAALKAAQSAAEDATTALDLATTAWQTTSTAVSTNQQRLVALDTSDESAAQAAALSRQVVSEVRPSFVVADSTTVYGIRVHRSVAFAFKRMIDDAKADGISLSGGGFRTRQRQIELRKINGCPDVYTAPASSCRVPTAIPGRSLHELGLAVDITSGGKTITGNSAAFRWLSANAGRYGYVNLPSEAWHWSITGG